MRCRDPAAGAPHPPGSRRRAITRGGSPPRYAAWRVAHAESFACRGSVRGTVRGTVRTQRNVIIEPPLPTQNSHAHYHGGALPGRRDGDIAPYRHYAREIRTRITPVSRCGRARCPHRAAAPSARCAAWHRAHAESFACCGSVRGTVRGRAAHPARCHNRAAITHAKFARALHQRITPAARWGHRALPNSHAHYPRVGGGALPTQYSHAVAHRRALPPLHPRGARRYYSRALPTATG